MNTTTVFDMTTWHVLLSIALFCTQFCRAVNTDRSTRRSVLLSFYLLTAASILSAFAPAVLPGWRPSWDSIFLLLAIIAVQGVTAHFWRGGTPKAFKNDHQDSPEVG